MSDLLTERSLKFYDGTYKWNGEGFIDEEGGKIRFLLLLGLD